MTDEAIELAASQLLDDETALLAYTRAVLPTRFGRCVVGGLDWRKAAREIMDDLSWPYDAADWLRVVDAMAVRLQEWGQGGDDEEWYSPAERERRRALAAGEICERT